MSAEKQYGRDVVIETIVRLMIPFIQLYGLYVMMGTEGAGGGFQGGTVIAASFVLYVTAFGITRGRKNFPESWNAAFKCLGLYLYAGIGLLCIIFSLGAAEYLNYAAVPLSNIIGHADTRALMIADVVEIGIGMTVMAAFVSLFFDLAWKEESVEEEEGGGGAEE
ncbi:MAG TPA: MnhB domain-containing protein [Candidatus Bathyarchaeia archaeon]|nr:MnhB domain-containing protein [Candidatus Bathyarchaeia archaeon]